MKSFPAASSECFCIFLSKSMRNTFSESIKYFSIYNAQKYMHFWALFPLKISFNSSGRNFFSYFSLYFRPFLILLSLSRTKKRANADLLYTILILVGNITVNSPYFSDQHFPIRVLVGNNNRKYPLFSDCKFLILFSVGKKVDFAPTNNHISQL